jgi:Flp pilus assembly protein TadB
MTTMWKMRVATGVMTAVFLLVWLVPIPVAVEAALLVVGLGAAVWYIQMHRELRAETDGESA